MNDPRYINLVDGINSNLWVTGIKLEQGSPEKPRKSVKLILASMPTSESFTAPFTSISVQLPVAEDNIQARMMMDNRVKAILYPLASLEPGQKTTFKAMLETLVESLHKYDFKVNLLNKTSESTRAFDKQGNPLIFNEPINIEYLDFKDKGEYKSDIDYDV